MAKAAKPKLKGWKRAVHLSVLLIMVGAAFGAVLHFVGPNLLGVMRPPSSITDKVRRDTAPTTPQVEVPKTLSQDAIIAATNEVWPSTGQSKVAGSDQMKADGYKVSPVLFGAGATDTFHLKTKSNNVYVVLSVQGQVPVERPSDAVKPDLILALGTGKIVAVDERYDQSSKRRTTCTTGDYSWQQLIAAWVPIDGYVRHKSMETWQDVGHGDAALLPDGKHDDGTGLITSCFLSSTDDK